jgi:hypothetical protein
MDAERHLLNDEIRRGRPDVQTSGERERTDRTMRRERDVIGLRHRSDTSAFGNATGMREVGLHDIDGATFEERPEIPSTVKPLAHRQRHAGVLRELLDRFHLLA